MIKTLALLMVIAAGAQGTTSAPALGELRQCFIDLHQTERLYRNWIPTPLWNLDRKLIHMTRGIEYQEQNLVMMQELFGNRDLMPTESLLLANSVEGCHAYHAVYENHLKSFAKLLASIFALTLGLALMALLWRPDKRLPSNQIPQTRAGADLKKSGTPEDRNGSAGMNSH